MVTVGDSDHGCEILSRFENRDHNLVTPDWVPDLCRRCDRPAYPGDISLLSLRSVGVFLCLWVHGPGRAPRATV